MCPFSMKGSSCELQTQTEQGTVDEMQKQETRLEDSEAWV